MISGVRLLVALGIALGAAGCAGRSANQATEATAPRRDREAERERAAFDLDRAAMQADLDSWLATLEAVHPNPYTKIDRAKFLAEVKATRAALPETADPLEFYARLQRLAALLRDSHTEIGY